MGQAKDGSDWSSYFPQTLAGRITSGSGPRRRRFPAKCRNTGADLPLAVRTDGEDAPALEEARALGRSVITVHRFCPYCLEEHDFELPVPEDERLESFDPIRSLGLTPAPSDVHPFSTTTVEHARPQLSITLEPPRNLLRLYLEAERLVETGERAETEQAVEMLPKIIYRYEDKKDVRSAAAARVLLARARLKLGQGELAVALANEAIPVLDPELDAPILAQAREVIARAG